MSRRQAVRPRPWREAVRDLAICALCAGIVAVTWIAGAVCGARLGQGRWP